VEDSEICTSGNNDNVDHSGRLVDNRNMSPGDTPQVMKYGESYGALTSQHHYDDVYLAIRGTKRFNYNDGVRDALYQAMQRLLVTERYSENIYILSNYLAGLGRLRCRWISLPAGVREAIIETLMKRPVESYGHAPGHLLSYILASMAHLQVPWEAIPVVLRRNWEEGLVKYASDFTEAELISLLWAYARFCNNSVKPLPQSTLQLLVKEIEVKFRAFSMQQWLWRLWELSKLGATWSDFGIEAQTTLSNVIIKSVMHLSTSELGVILWSLGKLGMPINSLPDEVLEYLCRGMERVATVSKPKRAPQTVTDSRWTKESRRAMGSGDDEVNRAAVDVDNGADYDCDNNDSVQDGRNDGGSSGENSRRRYADIDCDDEIAEDGVSVNVRR